MYSILRLLNDFIGPFYVGTVSVTVEGFVHVVTV